MAKAKKIYFPSTLQTVVESKGASIPEGVEIPVVIRFKAFKPDANFQTEEALYEVFLPVPVALNNSYTVDFENLEVGVFGTILAGLSEAVGKIDGDKDFFGVGEAFTAASDTTLTAGARLLDATGALTPAKRKFGFAFNKFSEMVVSRPGNRAFNFSFDLAPTNKEESTIVQQIINLFKLGMQPTTDARFIFADSARGENSVGERATRL